MTEPEPLQYYSVPKVATIFGVSAVTVRRWIYSGHCEAEQVADKGHWRVSAAWVNKQAAKLRETPKVDKPKRRRIVPVG